MRKYLVPALLTAALTFSSHAVFGQAKKAAAPPAGDAKVGEDLFQQKCFQCHSVAEGEVRFGPSLYHVTKGPKPRKTPAGIHEILTNGKGKMPSFKEVLTEKDMDDLIAYVKSL